MTTTKKSFVAAVVVALIFSLLTPFFLLENNTAHAAVANWRKGASIVPKSTTDFGTDTFKQSLRNLRATGATHVALVVPYYQTNIHTTDISAGSNTPTDQSLISAI